MQYMLMCYFDEKSWEKLPEATRAKIMDEYGQWTQAVVRSGHFRSSAKLQPTSATTTVREKSGRRVATDGPFAETREQLGGFHLIECRDLDEAIEIAGRIPTLKAGGTIEVRPVDPAFAK
jgi:hypothetical protein